MDVDDDADAGSDVAAGGLMGDVAVVERESDQDGAGLRDGRSNDVDADADADNGCLEVAAVSGVDAEDAGLFLHDG